MTEEAPARKAYVISVGTTAEPVIHSIEGLQPEDKGMLDIFLIYGQSLPGQPPPHPVDVAMQAKSAVEAGVGSVTLMCIDDPQDLDCCIAVCDRVFDRIAQCNVCETRVNFTGGTKTMAGALTLVAAQRAPAGLLFEYIGGERVASNGRVTGSMVRKQFGKTSLQQYLKQIKSHIQKCNYSYALALAELVPPSAHASFLKRSIESLVLWDNFEYKAALSRVPGKFGLNILSEDALFSGLAAMMLKLQECEPVKKVVGELVKYENKQGDPSLFSRQFSKEPVLLVADTLENARRRLIEKKHVDVALRAYRAMEIAVQLCLIRQYSISPWQLQAESIPDVDGYLGRIRRTSLPDELALKNGFELIQHLSADFDLETVKDFKYVQNLRNHCYLEHGYSDITADKAGQCLISSEKVCAQILLRAGFAEADIAEATMRVRHSIES